MYLYVDSQCVYIKLRYHGIDYLDKIHGSNKIHLLKPLFDCKHISSKLIIYIT